MSDLYPTPTRLSLLRDIEAGQVRSVFGGPACNAAAGYRLVVKAIQELTAASWCESTSILSEQSETWHLTDAGRALLAGTS